MTSDMQNPSSSDNGESAGGSAGGSTGAATRNSGLPMRGLAMILIAVAVLLAAWALWSMLGDSDESVTADTTTTTTTATTATTATDTTGAGTTGAVTDSRTEDTEDTEDSPVGESDPQDGQRDEQPASPAGEPDRDGDRAAADSPRPSGTPVTTLHVLNNSTVPQLAARVAETLQPDFEKVDSGNLPDVIIPRNTVYFTEGNPGAEQAARELADRVNGVAMERIPALPEETGGRDAIVLVLVEDINL